MKNITNRFALLALAVIASTLGLGSLMNCNPDPDPTPPPPPTPVDTVMYLTVNPYTDWAGIEQMNGIVKLEYDGKTIETTNKRIALPKTDLNGTITFTPNGEQIPSYNTASNFEIITENITMNKKNATIDIRTYLNKVEFEQEIIVNGDINILETRLEILDWKIEPDNNEQNSNDERFVEIGRILRGQNKSGKISGRALPEGKSPQDLAIIDTYTYGEDTDTLRSRFGGYRKSKQIIQVDYKPGNTIDATKILVNYQLPIGNLQKGDVLKIGLKHIDTNEMQTYVWYNYKELWYGPDYNTKNKAEWTIEENGTYIAKFKVQGKWKDNAQIGVYDSNNNLISISELKELHSGMNTKHEIIR